MMDNSLDSLEQRLGYVFTDRSLTQCALTHSSYMNEQKIRRADDYERLEFLGDAVLELVSSAFLFEKYPEKREGELTKIRASLVCEPALAHCARDLEIDVCIRLGRGEELSGGREKDSILCDVVEALIGAMYIDSHGIEEPRRFIHEKILRDLEDKILFYDAKSVLQEETQKRERTVSYELLEESGPGHKKHFRVAVLIDGTSVSEGEGRSKKEAEQNAAFEALKIYRQDTGI